MTVRPIKPFQIRLVILQLDSIPTLTLSAGHFTYSQQPFNKLTKMVQSLARFTLAVVALNAAASLAVPYVLFFFTVLWWLI